MIGVCGNNGDGLPSAEQLRELGISERGVLRVPVQGSIDLLEQTAALCRTEGVKLFATLNNECWEVGGDWSGWEASLRMLRDFGDVLAGVGCGNELDLFYKNGGGDRSVGPGFAASLVKRAIPILRPVGIKIAATSVAGEHWQEYLAAMVAACGDQKPDYYDLHPYGQGFHDVQQNPKFGLVHDAVNRAFEIVQLPVICSEGGVKIGEVGGPFFQAAYVGRWVSLFQSLDAARFPMATYFAWHDKIGSPGESGEAAFGLMDERGRKRPAWTAFRDAMGGSVPAPAPAPQPPEPPQPPPAPPQPPLESPVGFQGGFRAWHDLEPAIIGMALEPESGAWLNQSVQRTTNGWLFTALQEGEWRHSFIANNGTRRRWAESWGASEVVA